MDDSIFIFLLFILMLSIFLGFEVISKVPSTLHTPLMSATNAIHGITLVGAIIAAGTAATDMSGDDPLKIALSTLAVVFAAINVVGGYGITDRMLEMFRKKEKKKE